MNEYYVFDNEATAQAALDFINGSGWFPLAGYKEGVEQEEDKTTSWADAVQERVDGKFVFPSIPEKTLDVLMVGLTDREAFLVAFQPIIEVYQCDWFPVEEEVYELN